VTEMDRKDRPDSAPAMEGFRGSSPALLRGLMACVCNSKAGKQIVAAKRVAQTCEISDWDRDNGIVGIRQPVYELGKQIQLEYAFSLLFAGVPLLSGVLELSSDFYSLEYAFSLLFAGVPLRSGVLELSSNFYPLLSLLFAVSSS
jgi:hypothetical protein